MTVKKQSPRHPADHQPVLRGQPGDRPAVLRPALPEQLRHHPAQGRAGPAGGRRRRDLSSASSDYSMRVWLDPDKLASRNLTAGDVVQVLREQNVQVAAGQIGQPPVPNGPGLPVHAEHPRPAGRGRAVRRHHPQDRRRRARSPTSRTSAGSSWAPRARTRLSRWTASRRSGLAIYQLPGSNALDTADRVKAKMEELEDPLPRRARLRHRLRHHAVHPRVDQRGVQHAARRRHPGRRRRPAVPAGLEVAAPARDRRAGVAGRHLRRHGAAGLHA